METFWYRLTQVVLENGRRKTSVVVIMKWMWSVCSGIEIGTVSCSQVWKNRKVWEGFVKCCQRTKPQSFLVLLQLPAVQLRDVFTLCPELREPLLNHIQTLTPHQVARNWDWQLLIFIRLTLNECHGHNEVTVSSLFLPSELCHCGFGVGNSLAIKFATVGLALVTVSSL